MKITFLADEKPVAAQALRACIKKYGQAELSKADVVVVLGGDGFMLKTLHALLNYQTPVFGLNLGHVGYLLNHYSLDALPDRVEQADQKELIPLQIKAKVEKGRPFNQYAFNEFAFVRMSPQAARLGVSIQERVNGGRPFIQREVFADGLIVATPMGTSGYYASAHGVPVEPDQDVVALQSICARQGFNAIVSSDSQVNVEVLERSKRPVCIDRDGQDRICGVRSATIQQASHKSMTLLKDKELSR